jgi:hypothetical protein
MQKTASPRSLLGKFVFMLPHIHPQAAKSDPFHAQAKTLFGAIFSRELDGTARAEHAVPGQSLNTLQDAHNLPRSSRPTRSLGNRSVTRYLSRRQSPNAPDDASPLILQHIFAGLSPARPALPRFGFGFSPHKSIFHKRSAADKRNPTIVLT